MIKHINMFSVVISCSCLSPTANLAQIAFESVVSIVNSLHNSQELIRDQQGRNSLLATYLYWVFHLPDPPQEVQNAGTARYPSYWIWLSSFLTCFLFVFIHLGSSAAALSAESRYSTMGRATATSIGNMLLNSRMRSSSNPDIPTPQTSVEDAEVNNILSGKVQRSSQLELALKQAQAHMQLCMLIPQLVVYPHTTLSAVIGHMTASLMIASIMFNALKPSLSPGPQ